jgi:meso-butanediol dehydrogenase / (S,S)-butanediol dehydrogenase / diacetyl reductase
MSGRLHGKVCFITGTAGGQGAAAAQLFTAEGATVVGCDIKLDGIDLSDPEQAAGWVQAGVAQTGRIDVLYNNASATRVGPFEELTWDDWQFVLRNELDLIFTVTKAAWPHLKAGGGGLVINTASVSAWRGAAFTEQAAHGAAKGGVLALTRHLAASGARDQIRANSTPRTRCTRWRRRIRSDGWECRRTSRASRCSSPPTTRRTSTRSTSSSTADSR